MTFRAPIVYRPPLPIGNQGHIQGGVGGPSGGKQFRGPGQWATYDYPNPRGPQYPTSLLTWTDETRIWLIGKDKQFKGAGQFQTYDYPNPKGPEYPVDLRTFVNPLELQLIGKDKQFRGPGQWTTYDWPNPIGRVWRYVDTNFVNDLLPVPLQNVVFRKFVQVTEVYISEPVSQYDFYQNLLATTLRPVSQAPFSLKDWPNPPALARPVSLLTWTQSPNQTSPFNQGNWPNPIGPAFSQDLRGFIQDLNLELIGQDKFFGAPGQVPPNLNWPVPIGASFPMELRTHLLNLQESTLAPAFVQAPFSFNDWQNPWAAWFPLGLRTFTDANVAVNPPPAPVVIVVVTPPVGGGASGAKRYRQPPWWGDEKKRKLEKKVEAVQKLIQKKREQIDFAPDLLRMERLVEQLQELQKRLMKLLEQLEALNKEAEEDEVIRIYTIYRSLH